MNIVDEKILKLCEVTSNFLFIEYYSHEDCNMYKILNEYTNYREDKLVLCKVEDGIEKALDLAIKFIHERKDEFFRSIRKMYKNNDIVVCINPYFKDCKDKDLGLTFGKKYRVFYSTESNYSFNNLASSSLDYWINIRNDRNESQNYIAKRFISLKEYRKCKLEEICLKSEI